MLLPKTRLLFWSWCKVRVFTYGSNSTLNIQYLKFGTKNWHWICITFFIEFDSIMSHMSQLNALFTTEWQINVLETDSLTSDNGTDWMLRTGRVCLFQSCWSDILQDRKRWWHWNQFIYFYARSGFLCLWNCQRCFFFFKFSSDRR